MTAKIFGIFPFLRSRVTTALLILLLSLFLMQRCGLVLLGYSHIAHPSFDETASGVLACDLLDGQVRTPLFVYQYESRSGDGLLEGFLLVPFFKLLGRSLFSLKMLALASTILCLLSWILCLTRYHGIWAAIIFAVLFAFPPPMFARLNLVGTIGSHHLINPLIAVQLLFICKIISGDKNRLPAGFVTGLGVLAGLGTYAFYTYIIFNAFCLLFLLIFKPAIFTLRALLFFAGGFLIGFSPWILRLPFASGGAIYLSSILAGLKIDLWNICTNFFYNLPHSLGYNYPARGIGFISPLFMLFTFLLSGTIIKSFFEGRRAVKADSLKDTLQNLSPAVLQGLFFVAFPLFYLMCLSLAPLKIKPFEYWPNIGLFAGFSCADVYRYRWLHLLFPFYFGIIAVGITTLFKTYRPNRVLQIVVSFSLLFFLFWGILDSIRLYARDDYKKIFFYKGFNYDRMANRFILYESAADTLARAVTITRNYPKENRGEAYRCLGTKTTLDLLKDTNQVQRLKQSFNEVPTPYVNDFVYGIVRAAQNIPQEAFAAFRATVGTKLPVFFYENWGFRHLGYKYYGLLLNQKVLFSNIGAVEKWFFRDFLNNFSRAMQNHDQKNAEEKLFSEISMIPPRRQDDVVKGLGMLVGAEMLFDPMFLPDYPLNSRFGEKFSDGLQESFYRGVGSGFAETLCRFWRRLLLPDDFDLPLYAGMLEAEWKRCQKLMSGVSPVHFSTIKSGFWAELQRRHFHDGMRRYLDNKNRDAMEIN